LSEDLSNLVCLIHEVVRLGWHIQIHYILYSSGLPEKQSEFLAMNSPRIGRKMSITPVSPIAAPIPWSKIQEMMTIDRGLQQRSMVFSHPQSMVEFPGIFSIAGSSL
jgi:hypothetical protein